MYMKNRVRSEYNPHIWAWTRKDIHVKRRRKNLLSEILSDYCASTSLHGVGYLGSKDKTLCEKIWWLIIFTISLTTCIYFITTTWIKWQHNPVILSFEKEQTPIWAIPFPAVTVCPVNKVRQTIYNYTSMFRNRNNLTADEYKRFWDVSLVCQLNQYAQDFKSRITFTDSDAINNILQVAPNMQQTIYKTIWQNQRENSMFVQHINKEGLCFTFNVLGQDDMFTKELVKDAIFINHNVKKTKWTVEDGYTNELSIDDYPHRTAQDGFGSGISFTLSSYTLDTDYVCGQPMSGYKIILHNPVETAKAAQQYLVLSSDRKATIMIKPELITTSKSLRSMSARVRKCYFSNEKSLRFFKIYTQNNCEMECSANVTQEYCGCVPFYMPRDENAKICGYGKMKCLKEIEEKILLFQVLEKRKNKSDDAMKSTAYKMYDKCDCLPACYNIQFSAEMSHTNIHIIQAALASGISSNITPIARKQLHDGTLRASQLDIFFKESQFLALRRSELYGKTDFIASCGGLLGLFMGFSLLSLVEIIYFLTIRMWCKIRHRNS